MFQNADIRGQIQQIQLNIVSLGRCQVIVTIDSTLYYSTLYFSLTVLLLPQIPSFVTDA